MCSFIQRKLNILRCAHGTQTNNVSVSARMSAVTENVVIGQPADCSIFWLRRLQINFLMPGRGAVLVPVTVRQPDLTDWRCRWLAKEMTDTQSTAR